MLNCVIMQGRMVADPELRTLPSGTKLCSFRIAWNKKYKDNEQKCFLSCTAWNGLAEFAAKYFVKGQECVVKGPLETHEWTDKDGNRRQNNEIRFLEALDFCGKRSDDQERTSSSAGISVQFEELEDDPGELPF